MRTFPISGIARCRTSTLLAVLCGWLCCVLASAVVAQQDELSEEALAAARPWEPDRQLVGTVTDEQGQPVAGVRVTTRDWRFGQSVRVDADGTFRITVPVGSVNGLFLRAATADEQ